MINKESIPQHWEIKTLEECCMIIMGQSPPSESYNTEARGLPFFQGKADFAELHPITRVWCDNPSKIAVHDDVLLSVRAPVGTTNVADQICCIGRGLAAIRYQNYKYLYYYLKLIQQLLNDKGTGTTFRSISGPILKSILFPVAPKLEQETIVSKIEELFEELDKGKEQIEIALEQLRLYRQSVLKSAFNGELTNDNINRGELPNAWKYVALQDVVDINPKIPNKEDLLDEIEVQFLPMKLVEELSGKIDLTEFRSYGEVKKGYTPFIDNDVIFAKVTPCMENGKIAIVNNLKNGIGFGSSEFYVLRSKGEVLSEYIFYFLIQEGFRNEAKNEMTGAVGLKRVPKLFIENYRIPLPPVQEQKEVIREIEKRLETCDQIEKKIEASIKQSELLRHSILKKAFEGKLVKVTEIKQPGKNEYLHQCQILGYILEVSKQKGIRHGEMTLAKYAYLADRLYGIPTHYEYNQWHLGPYSIDMKKAVNNRKFFENKNGCLEIAEGAKLLNYSNKYKKKTEEAVGIIASYFSQYKSPKDRAHNTELLATISKVIEDTQSIDFDTIRTGMENWKIGLEDKKFKNKAEKFNEKETKDCLEFIELQGWDKKLLK